MLVIGLSLLGAMLINIQGSYVEPQPKPNYESVYLFDGEPQDIQPVGGIHNFQKTANPQDIDQL